MAIISESVTQQNI